MAIVGEKIIAVTAQRQPTRVGCATAVEASLPRGTANAITTLAHWTAKTTPGQLHATRLARRTANVITTLARRTANAIATRLARGTANAIAATLARRTAKAAATIGTRRTADAIAT